MSPILTEVALLFSSWTLNEPLDVYVLSALFLIVLGIAVGTLRIDQRRVA